ncbi:MAG: PmbA/TldA family metallopeptidase, partial [Candidatus Hodarchaeales archaeon]
MSFSKDLAEIGIGLAQDSGAKYAEARVINGKKIIYYFRNGELISGSELPWQGIGFRILKNGGLSFVAVDELTKKAVKRAISAGLKMANNSNPKEKIDFGEPVSNEAKWGVPIKERITSIDTDTMIDLLQEMDKVAEERNISTRANFFEAHSFQKSIYTTEGTKIESDLSMLKFFSIITAKGLLDSEQRWVDLTRSTGWEG